MQTASSEETEAFYLGLDDEDDIVAERRGTSKRSPRTAVVIAIIIGIVVGIWYAGRAQESDPMLSAPDAQAAMEEVAIRLEALRDEIAVDPTNVEPRLELGVMYYNAGMLEEAGQEWQKVVDIDPKNVDAWYNLGYVALAQTPADVKGAKEAWDKIAEIDPDSELAQTVELHLSGLDTTEEN